MSRLFDISPPVHSRTPVFPGDTPYQQRWAATLGPGCPVNVSSLALTPHLGAHADAPLHYAAGGAAAGSLDLAPYLGPCCVIHAIGVPRVEIAHLAPHAARLEARVLMRCYARQPQEAFDEDLPCIAPEALHWLADRGVVLVGTDSASLDPAASKTLDAHQVLRARDLRVLENLLLDEVPEGRYELIALPLRLVEADASPVRAVLRTLP